MQEHWNPTRIRDGEIRNAILASLQEPPAFDHSHVSVDVNYGIVTLRGAVITSTQKWQAERRAASVADVLHIVNHLRIRDMAAGPFTVVDCGE